jgi:hypothetical protein
MAATLALPVSFPLDTAERSRRDRALPLAAAALGFLTSLWAGSFYAPTGDDSADYVLLAQNVSAGHGLSLSRAVPYEASAVRSPVYPLFLALVYRAGGDSLRFVLFAQAVVLAVGCVLLTKLALLMFNRRVALATAVLFAANPYFGRWAGSLLT